MRAMADKSHSHLPSAGAAGVMHAAQLHARSPDPQSSRRLDRSPSLNGRGAQSKDESSTPSSSSNLSAVTAISPATKLLLTTEQAAEYLTASVRTVKNLLSDGSVAYIKIGRATRIHRNDLDEYIRWNRRRQRRGLRLG
jgi:excisionase family DNA binding protein